MLSTVLNLKCAARIHLYVARGSGLFYIGAGALIPYQGLGFQAFTGFACRLGDAAAPISTEGTARATASARSRDIKPAP